MDLDVLEHFTVGKHEDGSVECKICHWTKPEAFIYLFSERFEDSIMTHLKRIIPLAKQHLIDYHSESD